MRESGRWSGRSSRIQRRHAGPGGVRQVSQAWSLSFLLRAFKPWTAMILKRGSRSVVHSWLSEWIDQKLLTRPLHHQKGNRPHRERAASKANPCQLCHHQGQKDTNHCVCLFDPREDTREITVSAEYSTGRWPRVPNILRRSQQGWAKRASSLVHPGRGTT